MIGITVTFSFPNFLFKCGDEASVLKLMECEVCFYCNYPQVHSDLERLYQFGFHLWVKDIRLKISPIEECLKKG